MSTPTLYPSVKTVLHWLPFQPSTTCDCVFLLAIIIFSSSFIPRNTKLVSSASLRSSLIRVSILTTRLIIFCGSSTLDGTASITGESPRFWTGVANACEDCEFLVNLHGGDIQNFSRFSGCDVLPTMKEKPLCGGHSISIEALGIMRVYVNFVKKELLPWYGQFKDSNSETRFDLMACGVFSNYAQIRLMYEDCSWVLAENKRLHGNQASLVTG